MMIMEDSEMFKIEYDLQAIMYSANTGGQREGCKDPDAWRRDLTLC